MTKGNDVWVQRITASVVVLAALFALYGTNAKVTDLEGRVNVLNSDVDDLESISADIGDLKEKIDSIDEEVGQLSEIRTDLLRAIRRVLRTK